MKKRRRSNQARAIELEKPLSVTAGDIGIVLSGGGARAAYQVGALKALRKYLSDEHHPITVITGSSIGAINGLILGACLIDGVDEGVRQLENMWRERTFRNTFSGSPSGAFLKAIKTAVLQYMSPGPNPSGDSIFDPSPLMQAVDDVITKMGGLTPERRAPSLKAVGVMTTVEGPERKPLFFLSSHKEMGTDILHGATFDVCYVDELTAKHGFASAALPAILPPVELDTVHGKVTLVDGGISQNVPVDPVVRLGADRVIVIDISGRSWWLDRFSEPHDTRPSWEVPAAMETFCMRPSYSFVIKNQRDLGSILKSAVAYSNKKFISAVGPTWPLYTLLKNKFGEEVAYETMSYVALDPDYLHGLIERGYNETVKQLRNHIEPSFKTPAPNDDLAQTQPADTVFKDTSEAVMVTA